MTGVGPRVDVVGVTRGVALGVPAAPPPGTLYVARSGRIVRAILGYDITLAFSYDDWFEGEPSEVLSHRIARDIVERVREAGADQVMYFVPGPGGVADATVRELAAIADVFAGASSIATDGAGSAAQVMDALELAQAELHTPFDAGLAPLNPSATTLVTNWYGGWVKELASRRLTRSLGLLEIPDAEPDGVLVIPGRDPLVGTPSLEGLRHIYARLRRPDGCPWDREQTELTTVPHIVEEAEELREALDAGNWADAADELGDVLGNVIMIAQIAEEHGRFTFEDVVSSISAKLIRRHPHVFGDATADTADDVLTLWNQVKQQEREQTPRAE